MLWAYRCTPQLETNESPFSLVYGAEVMILVEIGEPSLCRELYDPDQNHQNMCTHLNLLYELRDKTQIRNLAAKQRAARKYNTNLSPRSFAKGDLVWGWPAAQEKRMENSLPIGTTCTEYTRMPEVVLTNLNSYQAKRYQIHGTCPISNFTSVRILTVPNTCNPGCTLFPHLAFFPKKGFGQGVFNEAPQNL